MALNRTAIAGSKNVLAVRVLSKEDLERLREPRDSRHAIAKVRDPHHNLARLLVAGLSLHEAARRAGYSYNGAALLKKDPAFQELMAQYRGQVDKAWLESLDDYFELGFSNMLKAERQVAEHLDAADEAGELVPLRNLIAISGDRADRFGYHKRQTNINVNIDFAAKLERTRQRTARVIESGTVIAPSASQPPSTSQKTVTVPTNRILRRA